VLEPVIERAGAAAAWGAISNAWAKRAPIAGEVWNRMMQPG
jgi:hypothetical protein